MVQVKMAGDQGPIEFVKSDEVFVAQSLPTSDLVGLVGCKVVATKLILKAQNIKAVASKLVGSKLEVKFHRIERCQ